MQLTVNVCVTLGGSKPVENVSSFASPLRSLCMVAGLVCKVFAKVSITLKAVANCLHGRHIHKVPTIQTGATMLCTVADIDLHRQGSWATISRVLVLEVCP